jgi:osmotically-inducible protein OsmY
MMRHPLSDSWSFGPSWSGLRRTLLLAAAAAALGGCVVAAVGVGGALGGAIVATDRRSMGIQLEDAQIEHRVNSALADRFARESVRIDVTSYNQKVLLAGQVPSEKDRADAEALANASLNVHQIVNELTIGSLAGLGNQTDDFLLAGKVRSALLDVPGLGANVVKVTCTDGSIYLFGEVNPAEADLAKRATSHINGVKRVVALFDLQAAAAPQPVPPEAGAAGKAAPASPASRP